MHHRDQILAGDRNLGCKRLIEKNPALVTALEMDNDHVVFDLDTPDDYCAAAAAAGRDIRAHKRSPTAAERR